MTGSARLAAIGRYPVKGLGGERLSSAHVAVDGLQHDRALGLWNGTRPVEPFGRWTSYQAFHALDKRPALGGFSARVLADADRSCGVTVEARHPDGSVLEIRLTADGRIARPQAVTPTIDAWFGSRAVSTELVASGAHLWDVETAPVSVVNLATVRAIEAAAGEPVAPERFRATLYVDGLEPWSELDLVGRRARIGDLHLEFSEPIERCRATTVDPANGNTDVNVLGVLAAHFGHIYCGVYAHVVRAGDITVGDPVVVDPAGARTPAPDGPVPARAPRWATVLDRSAPSASVAGLELEDPHGQLPTSRPGQHLRLHRTDPGAPAWRDYTISRLGEKHVRVSVRLEDDGRVSPWAHALRPGDRVLVSGPFGGAVLDDGPGPVLAITAGIGITPALAILQALAGSRSDRRVDLVHVERNAEDLAHWHEVEEAVAVLPDARAHLFLTGQAAVGESATPGRPSPGFIRSLLSEPGATSVHLCGSAGFTNAMRSVVEEAGVAPGNIRFDPFYSPPAVDLERRDPPSPGPHRVSFGDGRSATWCADDGTTLLDLAESYGVRVDASCRAGVCGTCATRVDGDTAYVLDPLVSTADGAVLICCAVPTGDVDLLPADTGPSATLRP